MSREVIPPVDNSIHLIRPYHYYDTTPSLGESYQPIQRPATKRHVLLEVEGIDPWWCSCGVHLEPACDISLASVNECFEAHIETVGGAW